MLNLFKVEDHVNGGLIQSLESTVPVKDPILEAWTLHMLSLSFFNPSCSSLTRPISPPHHLLSESIRMGMRGGPSGWGFCGLPLQQSLQVQSSYIHISILGMSGCLCRSTILPWPVSYMDVGFWFSSSDLLHDQSIESLSSITIKVTDLDTGKQPELRNIPNKQVSE